MSSSHLFSLHLFFFITHSCILEFVKLSFLKPHVLRTILAHWIALSISSELTQWHVQTWNCQQHSEDQYQKNSDDHYQMNGSWTLGNSKPVHIWDPYCQYRAGQNLPNHYCPQQNRWIWRRGTLLCIIKTSNLVRSQKLAPVRTLRPRRAWSVKNVG